MNSSFSPAWWLPGAHLQTLWGKVVRSPIPVALIRERWETPDGDFVDLLRASAPPGRPRLLLLHGLEGSPRSHYALGTLGEFHRRGWAADLLMFRSCSGEMNRTRRFYHSGETTDLAFALGRIIAQHPDAPLALAGVSLGGNVLLKFLGERGHDVPHQVRAAAAVSVPFDLARGSRRIERGFSRVYTRYFLKSLLRKAEAKLGVFPDLVPADALDDVRTLYDFDDRVTAPVHGFRDADDYYSRSSSIRWLGGIRLPTLLLNAVDDPFLPPEVLDEVRHIARSVPALEIEFPAHGGHAGFVGGPWPWSATYYIERRLADYFDERLGVAPTLETVA